MEIETFGPGAETRWRFFTDGVMGGVSTGAARIEEVAGRRALHLTGTVSTANRGGFVQARHDLATRLPADAQGLILTVRGNGERYFCHLRTDETRRPWQYYQAGFETHADWREVALPFAAFRAAGRALPAAVRAGSVRSVALVAYGRDHQADVALARVAVWTG